MRRLIFMFSFLFILLGCKTAEEVRTSNIPQGKRYAIGQGGGFTGNYTEFILSEDGKVHKYDYKYDREVYFKELNPADLTYFLEKLEALDLEGIEMTEPGNISYYIDVRQGRTSINKVLWGNYNFYPDKALINLHKELFNKLKEWE